MVNKDHLSVNSQHPDVPLFLSRSERHILMLTSQNASGTRLATLKAKEHHAAETHMREEKGNADSRIAGGILGVLILVVTGVAFFRRKRTLISMIRMTSEEWEDCLDIGGRS